MDQLRSIAILPLLILSPMAMSMDQCCQIQKFSYLFSNVAELEALHGDFVFVVEDYIDHGLESNQHNENSHETLPFYGNHTCSHA